MFGPNFLAAYCNADWLSIVQAALSPLDGVGGSGENLATRGEIFGTVLMGRILRV
jgi:hypothetical protein